MNEEIAFDDTRKYILSKGRDGKYVLYKKSISEYVPIGEIYDLSEVTHLFKVINGDYDQTPRQYLPSLDEVLQEHVAYVLRRCKGNIEMTTKILKISRSTIYRMIDKWKIPRR